MALKSRIHQFRSYLDAQHIDVALIWDPDNQFYLTGFRAISYSRPIVTLLDANEIQLIIPALEEAHAAAKAIVDRTYVYYEQFAFREKPLTYEEHLMTILQSSPATCTIGIELAILPASVSLLLREMGFHIFDVGKKLTQMRSIKDREEIELLKIAGSLSDLAIGESLRHAQIGVSELEFDSYGDRLLLEIASRDYPDELIGYADWTCSGIQRSEMPHLYSSTRKFKDGDIVVHSRQVWFNQYRAENERTFLIGNATDEQKDLLKLMIDAQQAGMEMIRPGISAKEVDIATFRIFDQAGYGEYVQHRTGHGLGLSEHEEPYLRFDNELILQEGMVYTIEPGVYIPGVGGFRHSDTVIITENGSFSITAYPRDLKSMQF
ncbi:Xaa-Pro peptidase family protein [Sporosarcina sp. Te-1]|uniref:M24 family metallopeptidase n=1 Tax=Sporosarcina sp. Te-1 TaxID=2818390 RepID=UPI001A9D9227|nr:Xaa-Pro peptidase family protein [Sporosarcina sp. Te-1]QTD41155.1 aminopeptidase P family protein [Sporosarcina sp. Te-1]